MIFYFSYHRILTFHFFSCFTTFQNISLDSTGFRIFLLFLFHSNFTICFQTHRHTFNLILKFFTEWMTFFPNQIFINFPTSNRFPFNFLLYSCLKFHFTSLAHSNHSKNVKFCKKRESISIRINPSFPRQNFYTCVSFQFK